MADSSRVDHPPHYGGAENPYEAIKVIEAWGLGFCLGNALKYICRAGKKDVITGSPGAKRSSWVKRNALRLSALEDLEKARWYLDREIQRLEKEQR